MGSIRASYCWDEEVHDAQRYAEEDFAGERPEQEGRGGGPDHSGDPSRHELAGAPGDEVQHQREEPGLIPTKSGMSPPPRHIPLIGCPLVTGSNSMSARIEFCHSALRHRNAAAVTAQKNTMVRLAMRIWLSRDSEAPCSPRANARRLPCCNRRRRRTRQGRLGDVGSGHQGRRQGCGEEQRSQKQARPRERTPQFQWPVFHSFPLSITAKRFL